MRSYRPRCGCGAALRLEVGPGLDRSVVVSAYCTECHALTMPYLGKLPREVRSEVERLRDRQIHPAPSAATAA